MLHCFAASGQSPVLAAAPIFLNHKRTGSRQNAVKSKVPKVQTPETPRKVSKKNTNPLLLPLSKLYAWGANVRNGLYDKGIFKSADFELPVIGVGNLNMGGTGKTPHIEYLLRLLLDAGYMPGVVSRGYKRVTSGYVLAAQNDTAANIGDEPLQIKTKFERVPVAVCEMRALGIVSLLLDEPATNVVLLDDVFQHRMVRPGWQILLTEYDNLYVNDRVFPAGSLREPISGSERANVIVVTKCPTELTQVEKNALIKQLQHKANQKVFFSHLRYGKPYAFAALPLAAPSSPSPDLEVLLVCGIARTRVLERYFAEAGCRLHKLYFTDHHRYTAADIAVISKRFEEISGVRKCIITTEKDAMRLLPFKNEIAASGLPIYCQPVSVFMQGDEEERFKQLLFDFVGNFTPQKSE